nr:uncharacterized protein LOC109179693 isoform X3 [Ipomoea batatas]
MVLASTIQNESVCLLETWIEVSDVYSHPFVNCSREVSIMSSYCMVTFLLSGLIQWNQIRQQWVGSKKSENQSQELREPRLSWNATYDSLLASNKPFAKPIPLPEMIDFLVDIWEQDGWDV